MFYQFKIDLANSMTMKKDEFPKTMVETQHLLNNYKTPPRQQRIRESDSDGAASVQNRPPTGPPIGTIECWHCKKEGTLQDMGVQNLSIDVCKEAHRLFSANKGWAIVQDKEKEKSGVQGTLSEYHVYINT